MNQNVPGERYRYSLAHEIGHAVMHRTAIGGDVEEEANRFASELLMPRSVVRADLHGFSLKVAERLKPVWKVSMQALTMRAWQLRLISNRARQGLFSRLGARGYRIDEPWPIPLEEPRVFDRLVSFHRDELGLSDDEMMHVMFTKHLGPDWKPDPAQPQLRVVGDESLFD
jgi:Zn-dependent peptidase ImmA (M78 family)